MYYTFIISKYYRLTRMHKFPDDFNKDSCKKLIQKSYDDLVTEQRQYIYDKVIENANYRINTTSIGFPNVAEKDVRVMLCGELIDRFDGLDVTFNIKEKGSSYPLERNFSDFDALKKFISEHEIFGIAVTGISIHY